MSLKNAIILHGTMGSPRGNWFAWLKKELEEQGLQVWLPELPHAEQPSLRQWVDFVHAARPFAISEETLIIGHSSGAILALILAQENPGPIGAIVAVSVFHDNSLKWDANNRLFDLAFDWPAIRQKAIKLVFVHSDNDPYVPLGQAQFVANSCQAELIVIPSEGHFNLEQSASYKTFPKLLQIIRTKISTATKSIVFVCRGNIARSAFAEALLKQELAKQGLSDKYQVISRGVQGTIVDPEPVKFPNITHYKELYKQAKPALDKFGVDLSLHRSTPIDGNDARKATLLLAMDRKTKEGLLQLFPKQAKKILLLSELAGKQQDIIDPEGVSGVSQQEQIFAQIRDTLVAGLPKLIELTDRL